MWRACPQRIPYNHSSYRHLHLHLKESNKNKNQSIVRNFGQFLSHQIQGPLQAFFLRSPRKYVLSLKHVYILLSLISIFSITVKMFYFFIYAVWDERFLVGGGLHWAYRQELGQTAQATQDLRGRVNLLLYTMTHVYSYPPISGSTQCQVSVLRLNAVCAIILDFFPRLSQTKNPCTIWIWKIKTKHKNCTIWKNILNLNLNLRNL